MNKISGYLPLRQTKKGFSNNYLNLYVK